jgi:hypothetical protein
MTGRQWLGITTPNWCIWSDTPRHRSRWRVDKHPNGDYQWTSPTNHLYRYRPPELPVPTRQSAPIDDECPPF